MTFGHYILRAAILNYGCLVFLEAPSQDGSKLSVAQMDTVLLSGFWILSSELAFFGNIGGVREYRPATNPPHFLFIGQRCGCVLVKEQTGWCHEIQRLITPVAYFCQFNIAWRMVGAPRRLAPSPDSVRRKGGSGIPWRQIPARLCIGLGRAMYPS
jgi:hypothetical protein